MFITGLNNTKAGGFGHRVEVIVANTFRKTSNKCKNSLEIEK